MDKIQMSHNDYNKKDNERKNCNLPSVYALIWSK